MKNLPEKYKHLRELRVYDNIRDLLITNLRNNPDKIYIEQAPQRIMNLLKISFVVIKTTAFFKLRTS